MEESCININNKIVKDLAEELKESVAVVAAKIAVWQRFNGENKIPTAKNLQFEPQLLVYSNNKELYKEYNLVNALGEIKTQVPVTATTREAVKLKETMDNWLKTLNKSPNYTFIPRSTPSGTKILMFTKEQEVKPSSKQQLSLFNEQSRVNVKDPKLESKYFSDSKTTTSLDILDKIAKSNHPLNKLAEKLKKYAAINNVNIELVNKIKAEGLQDFAAAVYYPIGNNIEILKSASFRGVGSETSILHEILHSLTSNGLRNGDSQIVKDFDALYQHAYKNLPIWNEETKTGNYALKNIDEFIVALFTDAQFIKDLQVIAPLNKQKDYKNLFEEIFDYILSLVRITKNNSLYHQAFAVATNIIEEQSVTPRKVESVGYNARVEDAAFFADMQSVNLQGIIVDNFDKLQTKVSLNNNEYSIEGFLDKIWKRASSVAKKTIQNRSNSLKTEEEISRDNTRLQAGTIIHGIQANLIKKAFPEANKHIEEFKVDPELMYITEVVARQLAPIIEKAKERGSVMKAEVFVANSASSIAGTIDLLEITKDGTYYVYDLKTRYEDDYTTKRRYEKIKEWTGQTNQYKEILEKGDSTLGIKPGKVEGTYIIEMEIKPKNKYVSTSTNYTYTGTNEDRVNAFLRNREIKNVRIVAPKFLKTPVNKINDLIDRLYLQIDALALKTPKTELERETNDALMASKLELVQELQLKADTKNLIIHVQTELGAMEKLIDNNLIEDAEDILAQLEIYSNLSSFVDITKENADTIMMLQGKAAFLRGKVLSIDRDIIQQAAEKTGVQGFVSDIFAAVKDISWFKKKTLGVSHIDNPLVATAFRTYTTAMSKARTSLQTLANQVKTASDAYKKFVGTNDFSLIIENGRLIDKYSPEFYKQYHNAKDRNNFEWFKQNVDFDKEKYETKRDAKLKLLEDDRDNNLRKLKLLNPEFTEAELVKALSYQEKSVMLKWDTENKGNLSKYYIPKDIWKNPKYTAIKEGQYKDTPVEEFYDLYTSVMGKANELFPEHISKTFIANFSKNFIEKTATNSLLGAIKGNWSGILDDLTIKYDENLYGEINSATGQPIDRLFVPGLNNVQDKSLDLGVSLFKFMEGIYRYEELSEVENVIKGVQRQLRGGKTKATDALGKDLPEGLVGDKNLVVNNTADAYDEWVKSAFYKQTREQEGGFEIKGNGFTSLIGILDKGDTKKIEYARLMDVVLRYTSLRNLGFNMYSPIVNAFGGSANMYMSGAGGQDYTGKNLTRALSLVTAGKLNLTNPDAIKAKLIYEYFAIEQSDINRDVANELSNRVISKLTTKYNSMTLMRESENILQRAGLIAMIDSGLHSFKWDDFKVVNGKLEVQADAFTKEQFRQKAIRVNAMNLGGVNPDDLASAKRTIVGRMLMQHRNWLPALYYNRFGKKQFDYVLERDIEGRYRTAVRLYKALFSKSLASTLTPYEQANLKSAKVEATLLLAVGLMLMALRSVDDDDKKETWYKVSNKIMTRGFGELTFFADPTLSSQWQILLSPAASISTLTEAGLFLKSIWKETTSTDEETLKRNKPLKKAVKMIPLFNKMDSFLEDLGLIDWNDK